MGTEKLDADIEILNWFYTDSHVVKDALRNVIFCEMLKQIIYLISMATKWKGTRYKTNVQLM